MPTRVIAHLDMDAFYASVELLRYPELRGLPVVIGGGLAPPAGVGRRSRHRRTQAPLLDLRDYAGRGVVTTATYEARDFGVNSAMGMMKAAQLAPDAVLLPTDFDEYRKYSRLFKAAVRDASVARRRSRTAASTRSISTSQSSSRRGWRASRAPAPRRTGRRPSPGRRRTTRRSTARSEPPSEADAWWCAREIARELKAAVKDATGLRCSIGLAPNKLIAKIASELDKPDGLTVVPASEVARRMSPLSVRKVNGVGPKSAAKLAQLGIRTIGELAAAEPAFLRQHFGESYSQWLTVPRQRPRRAAGRHPQRTEVDEPRNHLRPRPARGARQGATDGDLHRAVRRGRARPAAQALRGATIGIKLRFEDFRTVTRDNTLEVPTDDPKAIRRAAGECLKRVDLTKRIRLLGVRAGALSPRG